MSQATYRRDQSRSWQFHLATITDPVKLLQEIEDGKREIPVPEAMTLEEALKYAAYES
jgi:hypothetical protein